VDDLLERVERDFGLTLRDLTEVAGGADESAQLWRAIGPDGEAYAVKLSGGGTAAGLVLTAYLAGRGVAGVVAPVQTRDGELWSEVGGRRLSVTPWVSDARALEVGLTDEQWRTYGTLLRQVHAAPVNEELAELLPREEHQPDRIAARMHALDERLRTQAPTDGLAAAAVQEWPRDRAFAVLAHASRIGEELRTRAAPTVVCHGDPHVGNVLAGPGAQIWLIDWDDAVLAPPERDLMFVVGGVLAFLPITPGQQERFFDGYGLVEPDPTRLAYYLCVRALDDLSSFAAQAFDPHSSSVDERAWALDIMRGLLGSNGLVTLAERAL
jgi:spectinomycin phosphotransferase